MDKIDVVPSEIFDLDEATVARYLRTHPDFFIHNASLVEKMVVPHPVQGAISLPDWVMRRQRVQLSQQAEDIQLIIEQVRENEVLFNELLYLVTDLACAENLEEMLNQLNRWAKNLGLSGATLRLFSDRWRLSAPLDAQKLVLTRRAFESIRLQRFGDKRNYLGHLNGSELLLLLPNSLNVGSVAVTLLGQCGELGLIIFTSRDRQHYQNGMGTVLLDKLALLLPRLLSKWVSRL